MKMKSKDWLMFRVLVNKFHSKSADAFLRNLPNDESKNVSTQNVLSGEALHLLEQPEKLIDKVHYSWLLEAFEKIPDSLKNSVLASIPKPHREGLCKNFNLSPKPIALAPSYKRFLINTLYTQFEKKEVLPLEFLPENPLFILTTFPKAKLVSIIDYLGLYDLCDEIRHIVEKNLLTSIYAAIPEKKQQFLKSCLNQKEKIVTPRLDLENWDKDPEKLEKMLHKRGMIRLSHALSGQHPDFLWHIVHILDSGRGRLIISHYKQEEIPAVTKALETQVLNVINFLNKKS